MSTTLFVNGVTLTDASWFNDADTNTYPLTAVAGTNTITATGPTSLTAYATGHVYKFVPANSNTGATTLNISSLGAKNVFSAGAACVGNELRAGVPVMVYYDGTQLNIIGHTKYLISPIFSGTATTATGDFNMTPATGTIVLANASGIALLQVQSSGTNNGFVNVGNATNNIVQLGGIHSSKSAYYATIDNAGYHSFLAANGAAEMMRVVPSSSTDDRRLVVTGGRAASSSVVTLSTNTGDMNITPAGNLALTRPTQTISAGDSAGIGSIFQMTSLGATQADGLTRYFGDGLSATETDVQYIIPAPGVIRNLYCNSPAMAAGTRTFTVRKNAADTTITCQYSAANTSASDLTHAVAVSAGDLICVKCVTSGGASTITQRATIEYVRTA